MPHPQPPRKQPRQARSRDLVASVVEAAARVFDERGFEDTTMARVAEVAGVSVGSMYQYFPDKRSLVTALHERHLEDTLQVVHTAHAQVTGLRLEDSVRQVVRGLLQMHLEQPRLQRMLHDEHPALQYRKADSRKGRAVVESTLQLLQAHAEVKQPNLPLTAQVLARAVEELVHAAVLDPPDGATSEEIEQSIVDVAVGYLLKGTCLSAPSIQRSS